MMFVFSFRPPKKSSFIHSKENYFFKCDLIKIMASWNSVGGASYPSLVFLSKVEKKRYSNLFIIALRSKLKENSHRSFKSLVVKSIQLMKSSLLFKTFFFILALTLSDR